MRESINYYKSLNDYAYEVFSVEWVDQYLIPLPDAAYVQLGKIGRPGSLGC